jgi:hypothetical protein
MKISRFPNYTLLHIFKLKITIIVCFGAIKMRMHAVGFTWKKLTLAWLSSFWCGSERLVLYEQWWQREEHVQSNSFASLVNTSKWVSVHQMRHVLLNDRKNAHLHTPQSGKLHGFCGCENWVTVLLLRNDYFLVGKSRMLNQMSVLVNSIRIFLIITDCSVCIIFLLLHKRDKIIRERIIHRY